MQKSITFITSSTIMEAAMGRVNPILSCSNTKPSNIDHKFIQRYFPKDEDGVDRLIKFRKDQKVSAKLKRKAMNESMTSKVESIS